MASDRETSPAEEVQEIVADVWNSTSEREVARALARSNVRFPMLSVTFFRAAILWKFGRLCDPREVARVLFDYTNRIPRQHRQLLAMREAEAVIRAELNGEVQLIQEIKWDHRQALNAMQLVTRFVFEEAVQSPAGLLELRELSQQVAADHARLAAETGRCVDSLFAQRELYQGEIELLLSQAGDALRGER